MCIYVYMCIKGVWDGQAYSMPPIHTSQLFTYTLRVKVLQLSLSVLSPPATYLMGTRGVWSNPVGIRKHIKRTSGVCVNVLFPFIFTNAESARSVLAALRPWTALMQSTRVSPYRLSSVQDVGGREILRNSIFNRELEPKRRRPAQL